MIPMERKEYEACIHHHGIVAWCGRRLALEFGFQSLEHAEQAMLQGSLLVPCQECLQAARGTMAPGVSSQQQDI